ncbi:MAG: hypothetical protein IPL65_08105 [Lewinellaceae bacterium]|nr:hypothetical protein [Lewinellaceae bacterium]
MKKMLFPVLLAGLPLLCLQAQKVTLRADWKVGEQFSYINSWTFSVPGEMGKDEIPLVDFYQTFTVLDKTKDAYHLRLHTDSIEIRNGKEDRDAVYFFMFYKLDYDIETDLEGRFKQVLQKDQMDAQLLGIMQERWSNNTAKEGFESMLQKNPDWAASIVLRDYGFVFAQYGVVMTPGDTLQRVPEKSSMFMGPSALPQAPNDSISKTHEKVVLTRRPDKKQDVFNIFSEIDEVTPEITSNSGPKGTLSIGAGETNIKTTLQYDAVSGKLLACDRYVAAKAGGMRALDLDGKELFNQKGFEYREKRTLKIWAKAADLETEKTQEPAGIKIPQFPTFEEVVSAFFDKNRLREQPYFTLEKRPDGYWIQRADEYGRLQGESQLFWSAKNKRYLKLSGFDKPLPSNPADMDRLAEHYDPNDVIDNTHRYMTNTRLDKAEFDRQPFFNYPGWYQHVIDLLEPDYEQLNNEQLHALARAYSFASGALLHNNSGFADTTRMFKLPPGQNALSKEQLKQYEEANNKAVACYELLLQRAPNMETPVGSMRTKYSNEVMDGFLTLLYFQDEKTALKQIKPNLYDGFLLQSARNILESCPKDAVLFTYGDSDTYPLLYVQALEKFRTDVIVFNYSLLSLPRYYSALLKGPLGAKPLRTLLPERWLKEMIYIQTTSDKAERTPADFF